MRTTGVAASFLTLTTHEFPFGNDSTIGVLSSVAPPPAIAFFPAGHGWRLGRIEDPAGHEWEIGRPLGTWPP